MALEIHDVAGARWLLLSDAERAAIKAEAPEPVAQFPYREIVNEARDLAALRFVHSGAARPAPPLVS